MNNILRSSGRTRNSPGASLTEQAGTYIDLETTGHRMPQRSHVRWQMHKLESLHRVILQCFVLICGLCLC